MSSDTSEIKKSIRIVILGSGFAGVYAYLQLHKRFHGGKNVDIILISERGYFLFVPLIHEVATGTLTPSGVTQSIRQIPECCMKDFIEAKVVSVDFDKQEIQFQRLPEDISAKKNSTITYDYLVSALGSDTNFFNTPGAEKHALTLKNLEDAKKIKNRLIDSFEQAQTLTGEDQKKLLRFVIVGGGPTGVELAGEFADLISDELEKAFPKLMESCEVIVIQKGARLVPQVEEWFSSRSAEILLRKMRVGLLFNQQVTEITPEGVRTGDQFIETRTVVWTAGVKASRLINEHKRPVDYEEKTGRVKVSNFLNLASYPNVFVAGDQAWICDREEGQPYPMRAQFAVKEGTVAGENVWRLIWRKKKLKEFGWKDSGFILSLGKGEALAKLYGVRFWGFPAWWIYRTAYLIKIVGLRAKLRTALEWTLNLFLPRDISKL